MSETPASNNKSSVDNLKDVAVIGIGVGVIALGFKIANAFGKGADQKENEKKTDKAIKDIKVDASKINGNLLVYRTAAETLYNELSAHVLAFNTYSPTKVFNAIRSFNTEELKQVVKEFGTRPARLFDLVEVGGGGSLMEWFDAILDKDERETIREIFVFTGLDKLPEQGMRLYFDYNDKGWFDKENKMRAVAAQWRPFTKATTTKPLYPIKGNTQYLNVLVQNGSTFTPASLKCAGFGALGTFVSYDNSNVSGQGIIQTIAIKITDTRLKDWVGKTIWINSREINQTAPPANKTLYPL